MARKASLTLDVLLNGRLVGYYTRQADGRTSFRYGEDWLANVNAVPVSLSLPLRETPFWGNTVSAAFENLLPDNDAIRRRIAELKGAEGTDAFSLLAEIGYDCVGALQFVPSGHTQTVVDKIRAQPLDHASIARILRDLRRAPLGLARTREFRISIAGAQEKTGLLRMDNIWLRPLGNTPTTHILKPALGMLPNGIDMTQSVENEWLCLQLARLFGLEVANAEMIAFDGVDTLVVERFDRQWSRDGKWILRRPQEDMLQAQSVPPGRKYEQEGGPGIADVMGLLRGSDRPERDRLAFLRAQFSFWLLGATDGHAKNFSIFLGPQGSFRLTPLYDIMSVEPALAANQIRRHEAKIAMAVGDNRHRRLEDIYPRHWRQTARRCGISSGAVDEMLADLRQRCEALKSKVAEILPPDFPSMVADPIIQAVAARATRLT
ncbi:MAG: type II toxin-antitoxin system HipA family toxin [Proteobacteria bacterium]|nr:type II toxin-antitoxin system HipA family toxin [Pseudomonadota bacterium]